MTYWGLTEHNGKQQKLSCDRVSSSTVLVHTDKTTDENKASGAHYKLYSTSNFILLALSSIYKKDAGRVQVLFVVLYDHYKIQYGSRQQYLYLYKCKVPTLITHWAEKKAGSGSSLEGADTRYYWKTSVNHYSYC
jgi:hypothetical protein